MLHIWTQNLRSSTQPPENTVFSGVLENETRESVPSDEKDSNRKLDVPWGCAQSRPLGEVTIEGEGRSGSSEEPQIIILISEWKGERARAQRDRQTFNATFPSKSTVAIVARRCCCLGNTWYFLPGVPDS